MTSATDSKLQQFYLACESGDLEELKLIVKKTAKGDVKSSYGLHLACRKGHLPLVQFLMSIVDLKVIHSGKYAIDEAALNGHILCVKILVDDSNTSQLLKYALQGNSISTVKFVLRSCDITECETLFQDIRSLEVFQLVMLRIVNMTNLDQDARCFLVDGIHYQFKKIKHSIAKSSSPRRNSTRSSSSSVTDDKHISTDESTSQFLNDMKNDHMPPVPSIPRKMSLPTQQLTPPDTRKMSVSSPTRSILKSPSNNSVPIIITEQVSTGDKSPQHSVLSSPSLSNVKTPYGLI